MADRPYIPQGVPSISAARATLSTTPAIEIPARAGRTSVLILNLDTAITVYVGGSDVTTANGFPLFSGSPAGGSITIYGAGDIWMVSASGTPSVAYFEEF